MKLRPNLTGPRHLSAARSALIGVLAGAGVYSLAAVLIESFFGETSSMTYHAIAATGAVGIAVGVARSLISSTPKAGATNDR